MKQKLLELLEDCRDRYISGAALARELSVSRNTIWKAIEALRAEGYGISARTNKGYCLEKSGDILSVAGITRHIKTKGVFRFDVRNAVSSTNDELRELAIRGIPEGYVLVADGQTEGKGRMGRGFHSPAGHGAYFSLLLRPGAIGENVSLITSAAAVASARAIEQVVGVHVGIKWVNDLFTDGKKVCGILTEATYCMEGGLVESVVLGIGINITQPVTGFPDDIKDVATALTDRTEGKENERCRLIAATLDNFWIYYQNLSARCFLDEYISRSIVLGQDINVLSGGVKTPAHALEIDDDCGLVVRYSNGMIATLSAGEVSVREVR